MASARTTRTPKKQAAFLEELMLRGNVRDACAAANVPRRTVYDWRDADPAFARAWDDALDEAADIMEREAHRRAVDGVDEPVYGSLGKGEGMGEVGTIRKYSDTLLIFLLKAARPEKYRDRQQVEHTGEIAQKVYAGFNPDNV